jgi:hypothetical protein
VSHDVFISYSKPDKTKADAVCSLLERAGIRCWVAPRDVLPGETWGGSIVRAIQSSRVMILVLSSNSNQSSHVVREVERAVNRGLPIIPFRIDSTEPTGDMEFFIGSRHWLDALDPPLERHIERLAQVVKRLLAAELPADRVDEELAAGAPEGPAPKERAPPAADRPTPKAAAAAGGGAAPPLPPRVEPAARPGSGGAEGPAATAPGAPWRPLGLNPVVIAGIGAGGLLLVVLFIILLALALRNGEEGEPAAVPRPIPPDTTPTIPMGVPQSFVLNPGFSRYHVVSVAPGETKTATVFSDDFDAILEVMRQTRRLDAYSAQPEEVVLDPGEWQIAVESYDERTGGYQWDVYRGGQLLSSQSFAIEPDSRDLNSVSVVAGETKRVVANSSDFDIVLKVYEFEERVDRGIAGRPEEVVLDQPGDWEINVKSYDQRAGDYTLTVR